MIRVVAPAEFTEPLQWQLREISEISNILFKFHTITSDKKLNG